jgi:D-alanyl-D-alanine carboxypeptidase
VRGRNGPQRVQGRGAQMGWVQSEARDGLRYCVLGLAGGIGVGLLVSSDAADARHHYYRARVHFAHRVHVVRIVQRVHHHARAEGYSPPVASIVVDANNGEVLQATNADAPRHPASLTKIMTLYLLFERLEAGTIKLDAPLKVSAHATEQAPTILGVKAGQAITVDDAIKAVVTRSANDIAVAIAENIAGDEEAFAKLMTQKARALGMNHTTYVNASGLPDDDQITTARDLAVLGRAIQERFPRYYRYFALREFVYHGVPIRNHDHLLGAVGGVDGIKTGFTRASGFNLVTSVHRDGRYLVAVVLGGRSAFERDAHMRELIGAHIREASLHRTAPLIAEKTEQSTEPQAVASAKAPASRAEAAAAHADPVPAAISPVRATVGSSDPIQPLLVKTVTFRTAPVQTASLGPMPALVAVTAAPSPPPATGSVANPQQVAQAQMPDPPHTIMVPSSEPAAIATAPRSEPAVAEPAKVEPPKAEAARAESARAEPARAEPARVEPAKAEPKAEAAKPQLAKSEPEAPQTHAHSGWIIQIGAFEGEDEAKQHLSAAQGKVRTMLAAADPFTERVQKGDKALYRARFAGFDKQTAESACKQLKRSDIDCMAVKN